MKVLAAMIALSILWSLYGVIRRKPGAGKQLLGSIGAAALLLAFLYTIGLTVARR